MKDESIREGWFQHGYFHGPTRYILHFTLILIVLIQLSIPRGSFKNGDLNYIGHYKAGIPHGLVWTSVRGGGWIVGCVDAQGQHSGEVLDFTYIYLF